MFFVTNLNAQIKVWPNNKTTVGWANQQPNEQLNVNGDIYCIPSSPVNTDPLTFIHHTGGTSTAGFHFENFYNNNYGPIGVGPFFNEPILRPMFQMSMWLGNEDNQLYRVYSRKIYQQVGASVWAFSDERLKMNIKAWDESALNKLGQIKAYKYDLKPDIYTNVPEEKKELLVKEGENQIGFIAQEIKEVFPEMVDSPENGGYMAVNYGMLIPVLVEAIKEQQLLIEQLQVKVETLENK